MKAFHIFFIYLFLFAGCATGEQSFNEKTWREDMERSDPALLYAPHLKDDEYFNPWMPGDDRGFFQFLQWKLFGTKTEYSVEENSFLPQVLPNALERISAMQESDFILWIGHASFLMRIGGEYWLTDPVFSDTVVIVGRKTPPALRIEDLASLKGTINVVVSHNHYDHLNEDSIKNLPKGSRIYVPMGLGDLVKKMGKHEVIEMDWWEEAKSPSGSRVICLPAQHWSQRVTQSRNSTLWGSYLIIGRNTNVYFAGDSGYYIGYREIGRLYPGIEYVLMPVTAYNPRWFMHYAHMDAKESLDAFADLGAHYFIPTQWGTFQLGEEPPGYPVIDLQNQIRQRKLDTSKFLILDIGGIVEIGKKKK